MVKFGLYVIPAKAGIYSNFFNINIFPYGEDGVPFGCFTLSI